jgi:hypothetical protein
MQSARYTQFQDSRCSFLLEAESNPGPQCGRKDYVNDTIVNRTRDPSPCSAVSQPTAPPRAIQTSKQVALDYTLSNSRLL